MKTSLMLPLILGMTSNFSDDVLGAFPNEPTGPKGPIFTEEELALVRSLPKKERKKMVAELTRKYAAKK